MRSDATGAQRRLADIRHNIHLARKFLDGLTYEEFRDNDLVFYAVTRCLEIISGASRRIPPEIKAGHAHIPWAEMAGAGNVYRHDYEDVRQRLVWGTVHNRLPALLEAVERELRQFGPPPRSATPLSP